MVSSAEALAKNQPDIRPDVVELFDTFGEPVVNAYAGRGLFHITHSAFLDQIMKQGLRPDVEVVDSADINFLAEVFSEYGSSDIHSRTKFVRQFMNFDPARGMIERGVCLYPQPPTYSGLPLDYVPSYGLHGAPHIMRYFLRNMRTMAYKPAHFGDKKAAHAKELLDHYVEKLAQGNPQLVLLEVDPFAPAVINSRQWGDADVLTEIADMNAITAMELAQRATRVNSHGIEVRDHVVPPNALTVREARPILPKSVVADTYLQDQVFV